MSDRSPEKLYASDSFCQVMSKKLKLVVALVAIVLAYKFTQSE
ncbi:hypothetical protein [Salinibaculum rarum]|nr:hypothetical protein [Salinibaculum sp. KK48]